MTGVVDETAPPWDNRAVTTDTDALIIYTDGACSGNPGPGGWAWATAPGGELSDSGGEGHSTNQRMEIMAAWKAVQHFQHDPRRIEIVADSTYVVK